MNIFVQVECHYQQFFSYMYIITADIEVKKGKTTLWLFILNSKYMLLLSWKYSL